MSRRFTLIKKSCVLFFAMLLMQLSANAITYTAVASGNYSSAATWGGTVPSTSVLLDDIVVPNGVTVTLDQTVTLTGALSSLNVQGTLNSSSNSALIINAGALTGAGNIDVDSIVFNISSGLTFTGTIVADDLSALASGIATGADIVVSNQLWLAAGSSIDFLNTGSLTLVNGATFVMSGGVLSNTSGSFNLIGDYNVLYNAGNAIGGLELAGAGLQSVTVAMASMSNSLTLSADITIPDTLRLTSGNLVLDGNDLTITATGDITGTGKIIATPLSSIYINATNGLSGALNFSNPSNDLDNFTVNVGSTRTVVINGALNVHGTLALTSGTLDFSNDHLVIGGYLSGSGFLYGNNMSNLTVDAALGLSQPISFATGGQVLDRLTISTGTGTMVALGSTLTVSGELVISADNQFDISDRQLILTGILSGMGTFTTNNNTSLSVAFATSTPVRITGINGTIGTLIIDNGGAAALQLTGNLTVTNTLSIINGRLAINGVDLTITGAITPTTGGYISANSSSNLIVNSTAALQGGIAFHSSAAVINNITVNVGAGNTLKINSNLFVHSQLTMQSGKLDIGANNITIATGGTISGSSADNYIITSGGGRLTLPVIANTTATYAIGTDTEYAPAMVELNSGSAAGNVSVGVMKDVMQMGNAGADLSAVQPLVDATWFVESDITTGLDLDLKVMWSGDMEVNGFIRSGSHISHYTNGSWDATANMVATAESNGMYSLRRDNITSLSPFAVFDGNTVTTGINETAKALEFRMFPNPSSTNMIINCPEANNENLMVDIMNIQGGIVKSYNITSDNYSIPVSELANGSYVARVYNAKVNGVQKFTKM